MGVVCVSVCMLCVLTEVILEVSMYSIGQKECNKRDVPCAALIPLYAPHFDSIPESAPSCSAPSCKASESKDCSTFPVKMWRVTPNCGTFCKKHRNTLLTQASRTNPEANHKSVAHCL